MATGIKIRITQRKVKVDFVGKFEFHATIFENDIQHSIDHFIIALPRNGRPKAKEKRAQFAIAKHRIAHVHTIETRKVA